MVLAGESLKSTNISVIFKLPVDRKEYSYLGKPNPTAGGGSFLSLQVSIKPLFNEVALTNIASNVVFELRVIVNDALSASIPSNPSHLTNSYPSSGVATIVISVPSS